VLVSAAVAAAAAASDGTGSDVDSDVGEVVSDASSDIESLALGLMLLRLNMRPSDRCYRSRTLGVDIVPKDV
jgi:hypothetical protein